MIECEIISAVEVESEFQKSVPILNTKVAALLAFLNLVPGILKKEKDKSSFRHQV